MGSHLKKSYRLSFFLCHPFCPSPLLPTIDVPDTLYSPRLCQRLCFLGGWIKTVFKTGVIILTLYEWWELKSGSCPRFLPSNLISQFWWPYCCWILSLLIFIPFKAYLYTHQLLPFSEPHHLAPASLKNKEICCFPSHFAFQHVSKLLHYYCISL